MWNKETLSQLKSIKEIDKGIDEISRIENLNSDSYEFIRNLFYKLFAFNPILVCSFDKQFFKDLKVFRVRHNSKDIGDIYDPNTFSCPPWNKNIDFNRASWIGRNVFYGGDTPLTSLKETKKLYKNDNEFYVAKWGFDYNKFASDKIQISSLVFENIPPENPWSIIIGDYKKYIEHLKLEMGIDFAENFVHLIKRISKLFIDLVETKYPITAFIADERIYFDFHKKNLSQIHFPILIYPSVQAEKKNCNFAIHPVFVKQYMKLETVFHIKLDEINSNSLKHSVEKIGFGSDKNTVEWHKLFLDISKSKYNIESLNCYSCGKKIDLNDIDKIIFKKNNQEITHGEIIANFLKERDYSDFYKLDNIMEEDGIAIGVEVKFSSIPLKDITATINDDEHANLIMDINVKQPYEYKRIIP